MFPVRDKNTGATKYVSRSKATVLDNKDPLKRGRVRVDHPLLGQTGWIPYLRTNSTFDPPEIGDVVYVEADAGVYNYPVAWGNLTRGLSSGSSSLQEQFQRNVPTNRGWVTPGGNALELDDGPASGSGDSGEQGVRITTIDGNKLDISDTGEKISIKDVGGNSIELTYGQGGIIGITLNSVKNVHIIAAKDATIETTGKTIVQAGGEVDVTASGKCVVTASEIDLNGSAGKVLTTATDPVVDTIYGAPTVGVPTVKAG